MHIREATVEDVALIFSLIQRKAAFDRAISAFMDSLIAAIALQHSLAAFRCNGVRGWE